MLSDGEERAPSEVWRRGLVGEPYNFMLLSPEPTAMIFPVEESDAPKVGGGMTYEEKNPQSVT